MMYGAQPGHWVAKVVLPLVMPTSETVLVVHPPPAPRKGVIVSLVAFVSQQLPTILASRTERTSVNSISGVARVRVPIDSVPWLFCTSSVVAVSCVWYGVPQSGHPRFDVEMFPARKCLSMAKKA